MGWCRSTRRSRSWRRKPPGISRRRACRARRSCAAPGAACLSLSFPELRQYSLFHVKKDQGVPLVYASFVMVMAGLLTKLYLRPVLEARRRRRAPRAATPELEPPPASDYAWLASAAVEPSADAPVSSGGR